MARTTPARFIAWLAAAAATFCASFAFAGGFPLRQGFERDPVLEGYSLQTWRAEQGLVNNTVTNLLQTRDGYLWLGTSSGLVRFDGHQFKVFDRSNIPGLRSSRISALLEDRQGNLWIGASNGSLHRLHDHRWTQFSAEEGIPNGNIFDIHETPAGELWVNDNGTILRFRDERFEPVDFSDPSCPPMQVEKVALGLAGDLWLWGPDFLIRKVDGRCAEVIPSSALSEGEPSRVPSKHLIATRDGTVWLGGVDELLQLSASTPRIVERKWTDRSIEEFLEDSAGNLWIGTNSGLMRFRDGVTAALTEEEGLTDNRVWALLEDRERSLWLGTYDGLQRLSRGRIQTVSKKQGLQSDFVWAVYRASDGSVLIGHREGADRLRDGLIEPLPFVDPKTASPVRAFFEDSKGRLWAGAGSGPHLVIEGKLRLWSAVPPEVAGRQITGFLETPTQSLWLATRLGAFELTQDGRLLQSVLTDRKVVSIYRDRRGDLWFAVEDGLYRLQGEDVERFPEQGGPTFRVRSIHEAEDGVLWLGTVGHGLLRFDGQDFVGFDTRRGLPDDNVWRVFDDRQGQFWMCSDIGIFSVSIEDLERATVDGSDIQSHLFGISDGLLDLECNGGYYPSAFRDDQNQLWFPTARGVAVVTTGRQKARPPTFQALIESVRIDEREEFLGHSWVVPYDARSLEIKLTVPAFFDVDRIALRYRMTGLDPDWRLASESRTAVYGRLPPGTYQFEVLAIGPSGNPDPRELSVAVEVPYPPWRSIWAYLAYALTTLLAVGVFVRSQTRKVHQERAMVEKQTKVLQGFLPICAQCKSIREEDGSWKNLETYIDSHSEAQLSHGICPICAKASFPELT